MNNTSLIAAEKWLTEMGIQTIARPTCLMVNRTDMMNVGGSDGTDETLIHADVLSALKSAVSTKLFWSSKDDDYLYLDYF